MGPTHVFVSGYGRVLAVATTLVAAVVVVGVAGGQDLRQTVLAVAACGLGVVLAWALFWRPQVEVSDGGVRIVNVLRTVEIPWPVFESTDVRWSLEVRTLTGRWTAWVAPRGGAAAAAVRRSERAGAAQGRQASALGRAAGRLPASASAEIVAEAITARHEALLAAGHLDGARRTVQEHALREAVTWHRGTITAVLVLTAATVVSATA